MYWWRCQTNTQDSPQEFAIEACSRDFLEQKGYNVCGGPYDEKEEAEFWLYGGPPCNIMALDLSEKEIGWLKKNRSLLSAEEIEWLKEVIAPDGAKDE